MKYLKKITLINFQSHKNTILEFDEGLNIIVGPSDSGKSAIIRGIKWALYNDPLGDYFIREGEDEASVTLEFNNGVKVKRIRSKSKNAYILYNTNDNVELIFEGFGNKVPKEIIEAVSIKKIPLDSNETNAINLGEQLEGAFLLSEKGSVRASAIGRLVGVNIIDDTLKDTLKDLRNLSISKKDKEENINKITDELVEYEYLDNLNKNILKLEEIRASLKIKIEINNKLKNTLKYLNQFKIEKTFLKEHLFELESINLIENNILILQNKTRKIILYKKSVLKLNELKNDISFNKKRLNKLYNTNSIDEIINLIDLKNNKLQLLKKLQKQFIQYDIEYKNISLINNKLDKLESIDIIQATLENKIYQFNVLSLLKEKKMAIEKSLQIGINYIEKLNNIQEIDIIYNNLNLLVNNRSLSLKIYLDLENNRKETIKQSIIHINSKKDIALNLKTYENILFGNNICPFCLNPIKKSDIEHIIKHYS